MTLTRRRLAVAADAIRQRPAMALAVLVALADEDEQIEWLTSSQRVALVWWWLTHEEAEA